MFALRGIAVSLTFFVIVYCLLSAFVAVAWRSLRWLRTRAQSLAALLFTLRVLPLAASLVVTFAFVVPSFQLLEPRSIDIDIHEGVGAMPLALGIGALLLIACGCFRMFAAQIRTSRVVAHWLEGAHLLNADAAARAATKTMDQNLTLWSRRDGPPLMLVGMRKPRVLVSESALAVLSDLELRIALKHEFAHMRSHDNLKKLVFRLCSFPGMAKLEAAWSQAAELAADDAAVSNLSDAVDLAAALLKISRLLPVELAPLCTVGFVTGSIPARVARLLAWDEARKPQTRGMRMRPWYTVPPAIVTLLCVSAFYGPALALTHEVTEWLVR
jgi:Zn-dependent protease with chaperone function